MPLWRRAMASRRSLARAEVRAMPAMSAMSMMREACSAADHCDFLGRRARRAAGLRRRIALGVVFAAIAGLAGTRVLYAIEQRLAGAIEAEVQALERAVGRLKPRLDQAASLGRAIALARRRLRRGADEALEQARLSKALRALAEIEVAGVSLTRIELSPQGLSLRGKVAGGAGLAQWQQALAERLPHTQLRITELKRNKRHAMDRAEQDRKVDVDEAALASAEDDEGSAGSSNGRGMNRDAEGGADGKADLKAGREAGEPRRRLAQGPALDTSMDFLAVAQPRVGRQLAGRREATSRRRGPAVTGETQQP